MPIAWPAIIHYAGQHELAYVRDAAAWNNDPHLHACTYVDADRLIDSEGNIYKLTAATDGLVTPQPTDEHVSLQVVIALIRAHEAALGTCCVAKFHASSIREAIASLA